MSASWAQLSDRTAPRPSPPVLRPDTLRRPPSTLHAPPLQSLLSVLAAVLGAVLLLTMHVGFVCVMGACTLSCVAHPLLPNFCIATQNSWSWNI